MKQTEIDKVIRSGSVRQKIKLYFTDIALSNLDDNHLDYEINGKEFNIKGTKLLTSKQRDILYNSVKEPKDIEYYGELRRWNQAFLIFKEKFSLDLMKMRALCFAIKAEYESKVVERDEYTELVNELLDLYPDKASREKALKKALALTKDKGAKIYQEKGYAKYLDYEEALYWDAIKSTTQTAIYTAKSCKDYIEMFELVLSLHLPLKPYRDWVAEQKKQLKLVISIIGDLTVDGAPKGFPMIFPYEEIPVNINPEDVEDFYYSGG